MSSVGPLARALTFVAATALALSMAGCRDSPPQEARPASAAIKGLPDWVPIYPGARVSAVDTRNTGVETYTTFLLDTGDDCQKVFAWYDEKVKVAGFNVTKSTQGDGCYGIMRAEGPGNTRGLNLNGGGPTGGPSSFSFQAVVRQLPGAAATGQEARVPAWVPQYPGSKPANVVAKQEGPERSANFNFTTGDAAQAVIGWYERALKDAQFTIVGETVFDASTAKLTAQDAAGRSILNIRIEPAGGTKVVFIEAREGVQ